MFKVILLSILLCIPRIALAGFDNLIKDVFPSGTMSNVTAAAMVKEQAAGHFMGGSVIIKTPAEPKLSLIQARAPSCKLGGLPCGAQIELLGGGLSLVSGAELMQYLKTLPQNAVTYGAMMAIKTMCPQCHQLLVFPLSPSLYLASSGSMCLEKLASLEAILLECSLNSTCQLL